MASDERAEAEFVPGTQEQHEQVFQWDQKDRNLASVVHDTFPEGVHTMDLSADGSGCRHVVVAYVPAYAPATAGRLLAWLAAHVLPHNVLALHFYPTKIIIRVREGHAQARRLYAEMVAVMDTEGDLAQDGHADVVQTEGR